MARIRNVKPDFFRHEGLQDLEKANPGKYPMFVFEGLWTKCDRQGVFEWKPRSLKLDILPFLDFCMEESLKILETAGYVQKYAVDGKEYGIIQTFRKHQIISRAEQNNINVFPLPDAKTFEEEPDTDIKQLETDNKPFSNGLETVPEQLQNTGILNSEFGNSEFGNSDPKNKEDERPKLVIFLWQKNADIFNAFSSFKKPKDWEEFWKKSDITKEQIETAFKNYIQGVKSGALERRFIPSNVDTFVLNGWIQKSQDEYPKQGPPSTSKNKPIGSKKSLGGLDT
jgi:hypothetical protein